MLFVMKSLLWICTATHFCCCIILQKDFGALRTQGRDTPDDLYTSHEAERLDKETCGEFSKQYSSGWDIGGDFGQVFAFRMWSVGILGIR